MDKIDLKLWLPTTKKESLLRGWDNVDVVLFTGDAYIDHPSYGAAVIGRILESMGLQVALVPQPNWRDDLRDFKKMGTPRLFFAITGGNMDSMVNHYTANKRLRSDDAYSADGKAGLRPDYAVVTYSKILRSLFPDVPIVLGGIEASLRRVTHYDYWSDTLKPSILIESEADLLIYGMGEQPLRELVELLQKGVPLTSITTLNQTVIIRDEVPLHKKWETAYLTSHEHCMKDKKKYAENFKIIEIESNKHHAQRIVQPTKGKNIIVNPPYPPMTEEELDASFNLPYTYYPHPKYKEKKIPSYEMIRFSVNLHRGCFGGCSFCTISAHQGKFIASRSEGSILKEIRKITAMPEFKGYLSDLGGPSANMYQMKGYDLSICEKCSKPSCIFPKICNNLNVDHAPLLSIYQKVNALPSIKKAFIGSGVRYDMLMSEDLSEENRKSGFRYLRELVTNHVSGRLKVAPEHTAPAVLKLMRKPSFELFHQFATEFKRINRTEGMNQQLVPYFISSHPACSELNMAELAAETKSLEFKLEQVQDFTPTPMTLSTVIYYSGINPYTGKEIYTAKTKEEKLAQRDFFFWYKKEYKQKIKDALKRLGRKDLEQKILNRKD